MYDILLQRLFFVTTVVFNRQWDFYMADVNIFILENFKKMNILPSKNFKTGF